MRRLLIALLLVIAGCGEPQAQSPTTPTPGATATTTPITSASPLPQPSTPGSLLFAVLEAQGTSNPQQWSTVLIAALDGSVRGKTTFVPMPVPDVGCMGAILPQSAHVAAGKVYFADGRGVVRSLAIDGQVTEVARFSFSGHQQMMSFAVSPDGRQLLAAVFTLPDKPNLACNGSPATGYMLDVYSALAGGASRLLYHQNLPSTITMVLDGWDDVGPLGTYPAVWASQGGGPGSDRGVAVQINASTGKVLRQISDPSSCRVWDIRSSGDFICVPDGTSRVSVRRPTGTEIWHVTGAPSGFSYVLAPDEKHVSASGDTGPWVLGRDGTRVALGPGFFPTGWLDATTVVGGVGPNTNLSYIGLGAPAMILSLGFSGLFVGTVRN
jgi:hypothetical protein